MNRREFMKIIGVIAASSFFDPGDMIIKRVLAAPSYFGIHRFIESHPEAVFIKYTNVSVKTDSVAKQEEGFNFAKEIFTLQDSPGIPLSNMVAIKPNLTCTSGSGKSPDGMGILTDPSFVEGVIQGMKNVGLSKDKIYMREGNWLSDAYCPGEYAISPYVDVAKRTGTHLDDFPTGKTITQLRLDNLQEGSEVIWKDCPDGVVFKRIGYVAPFNHQDSWLLNIAKFKAHSMGLTLCAKNLQGMCIAPYVHFCEGVAATKRRPANALKDFQPDMEERVDELYARHLKAGIPRWDRNMQSKSSGSGYWMETWAHRTCDSLSVTDVGLNIIEGIYGRNGNAFLNGPGPGGKAQDFMTNVLIFGKNSFLVDIIGHWLGGHEPGNFGFFHIAKERGFINNINPMAIPVYLWDNGIPKLTPLTRFEPTPLLSPYLRRDYNGQREDEYHLVNEPYEYGPTTSVESFDKGKADIQKSQKKPDVHILGQNFPNPFNGSTIIQYQLMNSGNVILEVYNSRGEIIDILVNGWQGKGIHAAVWNAGNRPSGVYFYRFKTDGLEKFGKMIIAK